MPTKPPTPCTMCGRPATDRGRCTRHQRPNADQRGYGYIHRERFRNTVLRNANHRCVNCGATATIADHVPSRRWLVINGRDPERPANGRALCKPCHDRHTRQQQSHR